MSDKKNELGEKLRNKLNEIGLECSNDKSYNDHWLSKKYSSKSNKNYYHLEEPDSEKWRIGFYFGSNIKKPFDSIKDLFENVKEIPKKEKKKDDALYLEIASVSSDEDIDIAIKNIENFERTLIEKCNDINNRLGEKNQIKLLKTQEQEPDDSSNDSKQEKESLTNNDKKMNNISLNTILFGPPGTGKTYNSIAYAVAICNKLDEKSEENEEETADPKDYGVGINDRGYPIIKDINIAKQKFKDLKAAGKINFTTFHQSYGYEEFIEGIRPKLNSASSDVSYELGVGVFKKFCDKAKDDSKNKYVFIIDEINRGNISKIFGELITLIEESKRVGNDEGMEVVLPYSKKPFGVPNNVYILGTMNTADRSIALMDTALRRRFDFVEMMPQPEVLKKDDGNDLDIEGINIVEMLKAINDRVEVLYDREHTIGHAFFTKLLKLKNPSVNDLAEIFRNKVIPLLQEYFYEDYEKIQMILGKAFVNENTKPVKFANGGNGDDLPKRYQIIIPKKTKDYINIYPPAEGGSEGTPAVDTDPNG